MLRAIIRSLWRSSLDVHGPSLRRAHQVLQMYPEARVVIISPPGFAEKLLVGSWIFSISAVLIAKVTIPRLDNIAQEDESTVGGEEKEFKKHP